MITADEWLKKQKSSPTQNATIPSASSSGIISAEDFLKGNTKSVVPKPSTTPIPKAQAAKNPQLFSQKDPGIILNTLKDFAMGFIPGGKDIQTMYSKTSTPQQRLQAVAKSPFQRLGEFGGELAKGAAGIPFRLGLGISDLLGGPRQANIPVIGPQQSPQEGYRQLRQAGAGQVTAAGIPIAQTAMDLLFGKSILGGVKGMVNPKVTPENLSMDLLNTLKSEKGIVPDYMKPKPVEPIIPKPQFNMPETKPNKVVDYLAERNPYRFESGEVGSYGDAGKELVTRGRRAQHTATITAADMRKFNTELNLNKLTPEEQISWRNTLEGKGTPINDRVATIAQQTRALMDKYGTETGVDVKQNYFPRRLNEEGRKAFELPQNKEELVTKIVQDTGADRADAVKMIENGMRKGSFEFERLLPDVPDQFRLSPVEEFQKWQAEVARRTGLIKEFGPKNEIADQLVNEIGKGDKFEGKMKENAKTYVNRVTGRISNISKLDPLYNFLKNSMVVSKINPLTSIANAFQGHVSSFLDYGVKGLVDATFGKEGKQLTKDLGLDNLGTRITADVGAESFASKWLKAIGMDKSEVGNYTRAAQSSNAAIDRAFEALRKNPEDSNAYKLLKDHGMFVDDAELSKALQTGKIPEFEKKLGVMEGVRRKIFFNVKGERPAWANSGAGSTAYIFHNYILNQMKLLRDAPPARQLAYISFIAPMTGIPILVLRKMIQGKPLPSNPADWYVQASTAGPGTPADIYQTATTKDYLTNFLLGGFSAPLDVLTEKNKPKAIMKHFIPGGNLLLNRFFPPKNK